MNNQQIHVQAPQIFNQHYLRTDYKQQSMIFSINQPKQCTKALSVDRVKLKQANQNVEELIDLWKRHKSITQCTPTQLSQSYNYHSTTQKNESFIIEEIPETREASPLKQEETSIKPRQLFELNQSTSKLPSTHQQNSSHKKTNSLYIGALSRSDAFSGTKKIAKENQKISNGTSGNKKSQINSSQKKMPKEVATIINQLQTAQKQLLPLYQKLDRTKKTEMEEQINQLINQIRTDFTK